MSNCTAGQAHMVFEDFSGVLGAEFDNPYDALISTCKDEPEAIQERYALHRSTRNSQQKEKMLDENFGGVLIDQILLRVHDPSVDPGYLDPRNCFVFWARPTLPVKRLINHVQKELLTVVPHLWVMPQENLHMTALEVTHSRTYEEIEQIISPVRDTISSITDYTFNHRARLIKPMIGFDASALALSFVPAAGEALHSGQTFDDDEFTYHHLRRDLYNICIKKGVKVDSRYVVPSSHLTIGRFITQADTSSEDGRPDSDKMRTLIQKIEEINDWLKAEYWPEHNDGTIKAGGEWIVGEGKGLECRTGTLWYGGGQAVHLGKGF